MLVDESLIIFKQEEENLH